MDEISKNKDIDEIAVFAYDRKEEVNFAYNLGKVDWCPNGVWGSSNTNSEIAYSNDRSSYKYVFDILERAGKIDTSARPSEREYEIYAAYNKYYDTEAERIMTTTGSYGGSGESVSQDKILKEVADEYGITSDEVERICTKVATYEAT